MLHQVEADKDGCRKRKNERTRKSRKTILMQSVRKCGRRRRCTPGIKKNV